MMEIKPGIYPKLSNELYHGHHESYSGSSFKDFDVYPFNLIYKRQHREKKTVFDLGSAAHTAILEPDRWETDVAVCPNALLGKNGAKSTKAYKEWVAAQPEGKTTVTEAERDRVLKMRDSVHENPNHSEAKSYLTGENGLPEVSVFWHELFKNEETEEDTGYKRMVNHTHDDPAKCHSLLVKVRPDYIPRKLVLADLKTTATAIDPESFMRHAISMKYHWSAALALRGLTMATGQQHRIYVFVVIEVNAPYEVAVYKATEEFIALGRKEVMRTMERVAWSDLHNKWPGMPNRTMQVGLPAWEFKKLQEGI